MPLQQISVSPREKNCRKERSNRRNHDWKLQETVFATSGPNPPERRASQASSLSNGHDICRICHCEGDAEVPLIAPCYCSGSLRYVHQACLQQWIKSSDIRSCELCKFQFIMHSKIKPFNEWDTLEMSGVERRKILCSVTFHAVALTCVVWSLYILIDRTAEEIQRGQLEWPFWTKLIVVAIGFTGGIVFMYIQCKAYLLLCRRWRAFNRVIFVQNAPEKVALHTPAAQEQNVVSDICCGGLVSQNQDKLKEVVPVSVSLAHKNWKGSTSSLKEEALVVSSTSAREGGVEGVDCHKLLNTVVNKNQVNFPVASKRMDIEAGAKPLYSSNAYDFNERKPSEECGELSCLLHCDEKTRPSTSPLGGKCFFTSPPSVRLAAEQALSSSASRSSSEGSFPSPSAQLLQASTQ